MQKSNVKDMQNNVLCELMTMKSDKENSWQRNRHAKDKPSITAGLISVICRVLFF